MKTETKAKRGRRLQLLVTTRSRVRRRLGAAFVLLLGAGLAWSNAAGGDGSGALAAVPLLDRVRTMLVAPSAAVRQQIATVEAMKRMVPDLGMSIAHGDDWRQG